MNEEDNISFNMFGDSNAGFDFNNASLDLSGFDYSPSAGDVSFNMFSGQPDAVDLVSPYAEVTDLFTPKDYSSEFANIGTGGFDFGGANQPVVTSSDYQQYISTNTSPSPKLQSVYDRLPYDFNGTRTNDIDLYRSRVLGSNSLVSSLVKGVNPLTGKMLFSRSGFENLSISDQNVVASHLGTANNKMAFEDYADDNASDSAKQGYLNKIFDVEEGKGLETWALVLGTLGSLYFAYQNNQLQMKIYEETRDEDRRQFDLLYGQKERDSARSFALGNRQIDANSGGGAVTRSAGESYI